jgi:hypothetical protein
MNSMILMPGMTIEAVIKREQKRAISKEELEMLKKTFYEINGDIVYRPGMNVKVPTLE